MSKNIVFYYNVKDQIRNAWTPARMTTIAWYDPSDTSNITESGGFVSQLDDIGTGGTFPLVQDVEAEKPETGISTIGGLNALKCTPDDHMQNLTFSLPSSGDMAAYMVVNIGTVDDIDDCIISMNSSGNDWQLESNNGSSFAGNIQTNWTGSAGNYTNGPFSGPTLTGVVFDFNDSGTLKGFMNGTEEGSTAYTASKIDTNQDLHIFSNRGDTRRLEGSFGEIVICEDVTVSTRQMIEGYLAHKWALATLLPSNHPYKNAPPM